MRRMTVSLCGRARGCQARAGVIRAATDTIAGPCEWVGRSSGNVRMCWRINVLNSVAEHEILVYERMGAEETMKIVSCFWVKDGRSGLRVPDASKEVFF